MKAIDLLKKNPESSKLICSYYLEILLASLNDDSLPEDFKAHVRKEGLDEDKIASIIDHNPRNVFDVFDENEVFIFIHYMDVKDNIGFFYSFRNIDNTPVELFKTRKEAEKEAVLTAIMMLESKLTNSVND